MKLIRYAWKCMGRVYFTAVYEVLRLFTKVNYHKILFISDVRDELQGNLKCVWDYMDRKDYVRTTYLKNDRRDRTSVKSFNRMIYDFATAKYILLEDYFRYTSYVRPKEGQEICQLWHACGAYKKFGYSRANGTEKIKIHKGYKKYAKVITSSEAIRVNYAEAFGIDISKVRATGIPRTDIFFDQQKTEGKKRELYETYPQIRGRKVILFAPTYRGLRAEDAGYDFEKLDYKRLYNELHEEYVFVIKWHPALYNNLKRHNDFEKYIEQYKDFFIDLSAEREVNDLLPAADILITDYSSVIFEYALLGKPIIYFAYDLGKYRSSRGMYYDFYDYVYGAVAENSEELIKALKDGDLKEEYRMRFLERFMGACDGRATEKVCRWIFGIEAGKSGKIS